MLSVAIVDIWQWTPFVYLVMFAGLQTVPPESVEAAQVDGASSWAQFRHIELPYLRPLLLLVLFFRIADVLARVRPRVHPHRRRPRGDTQFLSLYMYRIAFPFSDLGQASALAVIVMAGMTMLLHGHQPLPAGGARLMRHRLTRVARRASCRDARPLRVPAVLHGRHVTQDEGRADTRRCPRSSQATRRSTPTSRCCSSATWPVCS